MYNKHQDIEVFFQFLFLVTDTLAYKMAGISEIVFPSLMEFLSDLIYCGINCSFENFTY